MSTLTVDQPGTIDPSATAPVPLTRLVGVELRKSFDTRAGRWFTISVVALCLIVMVIAALAFPESEQDYVAMLAVIGGTLGYFLPIIIILLVTSEWSQRTGLVTFTLEPRRSRVVQAKFLAGTILALAVLAIGTLIAAVGVPMSTLRGGEAVWNLGYIEVQNFVLGNLIGVFVGFALAMLLMNTAAAIVGYFVYTLVLPTVAGLLGFLIDGFDEVVPWIEFNTAQIPLFTGDYRANGEEWAQLAVSGTIWLLIPLALGIARLLRAEVK